MDDLTVGAGTHAHSEATRALHRILIPEWQATTAKREPREALEEVRGCGVGTE